MSLFHAIGLVKRFGAVSAADDVNLRVEAGEVHALIGPNGAGKTTLVNLLSGLLRPDAGRIELDGTDLTRMPPHLRVAKGLSRCFQVTSLFRDSSVRDNLRLAVQAHTGSSFGMLRRRDARADIDTQTHALAERMGLAPFMERIAGSLPHGTQRQLDIALALAARPRVLLMDEPMAGLGPQESAHIETLIEELRRSMSILLIEHDMDAVFRLANRISVLVGGRVIASGDAATIRADPDVQAAYLGS